MCKEIWRDIEGYEGLYRVSSLGNVKRLDRYRRNKWGGSSFFAAKNLSLCKDGKKYLFVKLTKEGKRKAFKVHRLVASAFLSKISGLNQVNHKDFDKNNNSVDNLEWCNDYENQSHKYHNVNGRSSNYIGVHFREFLKSKPYVAAIGVCGKFIHLGCFENEELAHEAYLSALDFYGFINKYAVKNKDNGS